MQNIRKTAFVLLLPVLLLGWGLNGLHYLWQDHEHSHCEEQHGPAWDNEHEECFVCDFQEILPDLPTTQTYSSFLPPESMYLCGFSQLHSTPSRDHTCLRGPPSDIFA